MRPLVIAHRTCPRDAPENSLAGIARARELGVDAVELDVRRSADGVPMLLHDRRLLRTTGRLATIDRVPASELRGLRLRGGGTLPTFAEALAALGPTMRVAIDVKDAGAGPAVVAEVRNQRLEARALFWSQHEEAVQDCASMAPEIERSLLRDTSTPDELERFLADATRLGVRGVSAHWSQVALPLAERCERLGLLLYAWCRRPEIDRQKLVLLHGLVTDRPDRARMAIDALER